MGDPMRTIDPAGTARRRLPRPWRLRPLDGALEHWSTGAPESPRLRPREPLCEPVKQHPTSPTASHGPHAVVVEEWRKWETRLQVLIAGTAKPGKRDATCSAVPVAPSSIQPRTVCGALQRSAAFCTHSGRGRRAQAPTGTNLLTAPIAPLSTLGRPQASANWGRLVAHRSSPSRP